MSGSANRIWALVLRHINIWRSSVMRLIDSIYWPAVQMVMWGFMTKFLQAFGSSVVRRLSDTEVTDATSGFRAYSREAALQLLVVDNFTYTLESLIQAGKAQRFLRSDFVSGSWMMPRLPVNWPRSGTAWIAPKGSTRFCSGIVFSLDPHLG